MYLLGFGDHNGFKQLVQLVLDEVWQLTHPALVHLYHVQIQLELLGDGWVGGLTVLGVLSGLTGQTDGGGGVRRDRAVHLVQYIIDQRFSTPVLTPE